MIIKLAVSRGEREQEKINSCCQANKCRYISIYKNKFGILTDAEDRIAIGQEASDQNKTYNIKQFVDIYTCAKHKSLIPYRTSRKGPYASILLDNQYFINLISYCINKDIIINYVDFITPQGTHHTETDIDEIKQEFDSDKAIVLSLSYEDNDIIVKKSGYIIIASGIGYNYYDENKDAIDEIIAVGFRTALC
jgi:hypothetical protein